MAICTKHRFSGQSQASLIFGLTLKRSSPTLHTESGRTVKKTRTSSKPNGWEETGSCTIVADNTTSRRSLFKDTHYATFQISARILFDHAAARGRGARSLLHCNCFRFEHQPSGFPMMFACLRLLHHRCALWTSSRIIKVPGSLSLWTFRHLTRKVWYSMVYIFRSSLSARRRTQTTYCLHAEPTAHLHSSISRLSRR